MTQVKLIDMKWLVGLLCLLNAGLFLWASGHGPGGFAPASAYPVVKPDNMRLLDELREREAAGGGAERRCARLGPFLDSAVAALAAQKLDTLGLSYTRRTIKARDVRAFRVFLGPFETPSALEARRRLLEAGEVQDFYVKRRDEQGAGIISLGLFSQRDGAELLADRLERLDIRPRIRTEDRTLEPSFWLEIDDPTVARHLPPALADANWGEQAARLRRYECP